jgi:hypothetical protein
LQNGCHESTTNEGAHRMQKMGDKIDGKRNVEIKKTSGEKPEVFF